MSPGEDRGNRIKGLGYEAAKHMYEKLGFSTTGDADGDEIIMVKMFENNKGEMDE